VSTPLALPTGGRGQGLALALTLVAAGAVWFAIMAPLWQWYEDRAEMLQRQQAMAHRMASIVATLPALRREALRVNRPGSTADNGSDFDTSAALLSGDTDALAAASLQQRIDEFATKAGLRIGSEEILPAQQEANLRTVAVRVTITAQYRPLVTWMLALARSETPIVADEIQLRGSAGNAADLPLDVGLTVTSWRAAKADVR
jgi:general secretion pathway protein M